MLSLVRVTTSPPQSLEGSRHTPERKREGQCRCCYEISSGRGDLRQGLAVLWVPPAGGTWGPGPGRLSVNVANSASSHPLGASLSASHHGRQGASPRAVGGLARCPAPCTQPLLNTRPPPGHQVRAKGGTGAGGRAVGPRLSGVSLSEGRSDGPWSQQRQFSKTKSFCLAPMTCIAEPHDFSAAIDTNVNWANL